MSDDDRRSVWFNIYLLFSLVWGGRMQDVEALTWGWWFYATAFLISSIAAAIQFVGIVRTRRVKS